MSKKSCNNFMNETLKIAYIADLHISHRGELVRNIPVEKNFEQLVPQVVKTAPDLIIFGGDQAAWDGETNAYHQIESLLKGTGIPYLGLAGNHDDIPRLNELFSLELTTDELYYTKTVKGKRLFFLDSSKHSVSQEQLEWLKEEAASEESEALLFIHHPPTRCGCRYMDRDYPLRNGEELFSLLKTIPNIRYIFCGHYHTEKTFIKNGKTIFITPSTAFQLSQENPEYEVSSYQPGWRWIEWDGEELGTSVRYLPLQIKN